MNRATFAAGCFWGVEQVFSQVTGVKTTQVGYTGGNTHQPTYQQVCSGKTGHTEAVQIIYAPDVVSYQQLLEVFWQCHNPTTLNRQGPDVGNQYRSAIFWHTEEQRELAIVAKAAIEQAGHYSTSIVTQIEQCQRFYSAEEHHQGYLLRRQGGCLLSAVSLDKPDCSRVTA